MYIAVIESEDGYVYEQMYDEFEQLIELYIMLGPSYRIVAIY